MNRFFTKVRRFSTCQYYRISPPPPQWPIVVATGWLCITIQLRIHVDTVDRLNQIEEKIAKLKTMDIQ